MADLTSDDRKNYEKLKEAVAKLDYSKIEEPIKSLTDRIKSEIQHDLNNTIELRRRIDLVNSYLIVHTLYLPDRSTDVAEITGVVSKIDDSLKTVEDQKLELEDSDEFEPDVLFLEFVDPAQKEPTQKLINDVDPLLNESQIKTLTSAWQTAVEKFVEDARKNNEKKAKSPAKDDKVKPLEPQTFAHFFRIQKELEVLYGRLANSETVREG